MKIQRDLSSETESQSVVMAESFRRMSVRAQRTKKVGSLSPPLTHPGVCFYLCWFVEACAEFGFFD